MERASLRILWAMIIAAAALCLPPGLAAEEGEAVTEEERQIIRSTCTPCHSDSRILTTDPAKIRPVIEDMKAKNPALFADVETRILGAALEKMLRDPQVAARRKAWEDLVSRGRELFSDPSLGRTGKSCVTCHTPDQLAGVAADFPKFDEKLNRYVSLLDKINFMISSNMGGKDLPLGDPLSIALVAYLKSL